MLSQSKNTVQIKSGILILLFLFCPLMNAIAGQLKAFNLEQVADGIYVHQGIHVDIDDPQHDDIANIGFIVGNKCVAVIDTGGSVAIGQKLKHAIRQTSKLPVCYVINTHVHFDHVLGNKAFTNTNPKFVGHRTLRNAIDNNRSFFLESFSAELGPGANEASIIAPNILVRDKLELDLGNRKIVLSAHPTAHTNQDLTVLDRKTNTLWLGDLLFMERIPALNGSLKQWLKIINKLRRSNVRQVIPGHGPPIADWPAASNAQMRYFNVLLKDIRKIIAKGGFIEEAIQNVGIDEKPQWRLFDQVHKRNVTRVFTELEWE